MLHYVQICSVFLPVIPTLKVNFSDANASFYNFSFALTKCGELGTRGCSVMLRTTAVFGYIVLQNNFRDVTSNKIPYFERLMGFINKREIKKLLK